ncbi:papilin-like, partial [Limulus polyphemus]|uniref:Papilin-like n=1 Tax=Limulus polyphemus TaxID=6850 RepID=A0ABM1SDD3_LIMPO
SFTLVLSIILLLVPDLYARHRLRHERHKRRQSLFSSQNIAVGLDNVSADDSGSWGPWSDSSKCSRSCGGGVAFQSRNCTNASISGGHSCMGSSKRFFSCNIQDCPHGSRDFREEQCSNFNSLPFENKYYSWVPYLKESNPCELNCNPVGELFYIRHSRKVIDGTRCYNDGSRDVCVDGVCMPVGCDLMLGSNAKKDKCGECGGDGNNCRTIEGLITDNNLQVGYNDIILIPVGSTNIKVTEKNATNNYLAVRNMTGHYYLNGNWGLVFSGILKFAGTKFHYERKSYSDLSTEHLWAHGPTTEPLFIVLLYQEKTPGITYEYSVPKNMSSPQSDAYSWTFDDFSDCSRTCGGGFQQRAVRCVRTSGFEEVPEFLCDPLLKPITNRTCNKETCPPVWFVGEWSNCSRQCGRGVQFRVVYCHRFTENGVILVSDDDCERQNGSKPSFIQHCTTGQKCPTWYAGPWSACNKICGNGTQTRTVTCQKDKEKIGDFQCDSESRPVASQTCNLGPCEGVEWIVSDWSGCDKLCGLTVESRVTHCANRKGKVFSPDMCDKNQLPELKRPCSNSHLCESSWFASEWSECSTKCGEGVQTRNVFCGYWKDNEVVKAQESQCNSHKKYAATRNCTGPPCKTSWFTGPWNRCSVPCGGGYRKRKILCISEENFSSSKDCDSSLRPYDEEPCNMYPCDEDEIIIAGGCKKTKHGCCPDGVTPAGPNISGCPKLSFPKGGCEVTDFGCCKDGITLAFGPFKEGCEIVTTCNGTKFGCCPDGLTPAHSEAGNGCPSNEECKDSTYGCCLDGETAAKGQNGEGCPRVEKCEDSAFGCCPDGETPAQDKYYYGCSNNTTCQDSPYGCCLDGITFAKDVNLTGCIESHLITCQISEYGCCPDNITSALGPELFGCDEFTSGEMCDISLYGCCPDGLTPASGPRNEGCSEADIPSIASEDVEGSGGCEGAEYGCCPDGISIAQGPGFGGCDDIQGSGKLEACIDSLYGCCSDNVTSAKGPHGESCVELIGTNISINCKGSPFGCCSDNITIAKGPNEEGCKELNITGVPINCTETAFGCCPDNVTSALGPDMEGCTVSEPTKIDFACLVSHFGCCSDGFTYAEGPNNKGCCRVTKYGCCQDNITASQGPAFEGCEEVNVTEQESKEVVPDCSTFLFGCCPDDITPSQGPNGEGCCFTSRFGCCPDNITTATGPEYFGCGCQAFPYGCCPDDVTPASGPRYSGCTCKEYPFGCCQDDYFPANGPNLEGCLCDRLLYGCCDDGITPATGHHKKGCGCSTTKFGCCPNSSSVASGPQYQGCSCDLFGQGCCPDGNTPAKGPDYEECPCETLPYGCCPDNLTPARGLNYEGCGCKFDKHGCCPDGITTAKGPNYHGCLCETFPYRCCPDGQTSAKGPNYQGCPCETLSYGCCPDKYTPAEGPDYQGCPCETLSHGCCPDKYTPAEGPDYQGCPCETLSHGCCPDNHTMAEGPDYQGCPCETLSHGCCPDNHTMAEGPDYQGCPCETLSHGCCPDNHTTAEGPDYQGCSCETFSYGCCPDRTIPAKGPNYQGCPCETLSHGCCPDNQTPAEGPDYQGCSCETFSYGCCPDKTIPAKGPNYQGCPCETFLYGCCPDKQTPAKATNYQGCPCSTMPYGCCPDGVTVAKGPHYEGCSCVDTPYGCCPDGKHIANGSNFEGCPDVPVIDLKISGEVCKLPQEVGACRDYVVKWFFDIEYGGCTRFWYGGCGGNRNQFNSEEECKNVCVEPKGGDACVLPKVQGSCNAPYKAWYFNTDKKLCESFNYSGCLGNNNRFISKEICEETCITQDLLDVCDQPLVVGPCMGSFSRWYYNRFDGRCKQFKYGGCKGNENNFATESQCEHRCASLSAKEICVLPKAEGPCREKLTRWYFDFMTEQCKEFTFSGCQGNRNQFLSRKQCENICTITKVSVSKDICSLSKSAGPCGAFLIRWFFNSQTGRCEQFYYGGCEGNANNFEKRRDCELACLNFSGRNECILPKDIGNCYEFNVRWFYDSEEGECRRFYYSGCGGNENNFNSLLKCQKRCGKPASTEILSEEFRTEICFLKEDKGPCTEVKLRFFYDKNDGVCKEFRYGGCLGNENRFRTRSECENKCGNSQNACLLPQIKGPCQGTFPQWYYDHRSDQCIEFMYGGCEGNSNRFNSRENCEDSCKQSTTPLTIPTTLPVQPETTTKALYKKIALPTDVCAQPRDKGPCKAFSPQWYYDSRNNICKRFIYGGCEGNRNRFKERSDCELRCVKKPTEEIKVDEVAEKEQEEVSTTVLPEGPTCPPTNCAKIRCTFGIDEYLDKQGCTLCRCFDPCQVHTCEEGERCVVRVYYNEDEDPKSETVCRKKKKPGECPFTDSFVADEPLKVSRRDCKDYCNDDADCIGGNKCCFNGCANICTEPALTTTPIPTTTELVPQEITVKSESQVILNCLDQDVAVIAAQWKKDELPVNLITERFRLLSNGSLQINSVKIEDAGLYKCESDKEMDIHLYHSINLIVQERLDIMASIASREYKTGSVLQLDCKVKGPKDTYVRWNFGPSPIQNSERLQALSNYTLIIQSTQHNDSGIYSCIATSKHSEASSSVSITIEDVYIPPDCVDWPQFVGCKTIVQANYCMNPHYGKYCCRSCTLAGQLSTKFTSPHV